MNRNAMLLRGMIILLLVGGGFIWMAQNNLDFALSEVGLQLLVVSGMVVLLIVLAFLAAVGLRGLIQRLNERKK